MFSKNIDFKHQWNNSKFERKRKQDRKRNEIKKKKMKKQKAKRAKKTWDFIASEKNAISI